MRWKSTATVLVSTLALSACCSKPHLAVVPTALLVKCPPSLTAPTDGTAYGVALTMAEWAGQYHDCRILHDGLVDALVTE